MVVLFVHGMGRTPFSAWPMLRKLREAGLKTETFGYVAALETFDAIALRLTARIEKIARGGPYVVVGHSLGGVLLRAALCALRPGIALPDRMFLLGVPIQPSRMAARLKKNRWFRLLAGDCGQLLGSAERMSGVGKIAIPVTGVAGVKGFFGSARRFGDEPNDGVVSLSEVSARWLSTQVRLPVIHTLLPSSHEVAALIIRDVAANAG